MTPEQSIVERIRRLPSAQQQEVLDFADALLQERQQKEARLIERYRSGEISCGKLGEQLGFTSLWEAEAFLQEKGIDLNYDEQELASDLQASQRLSIAKQDSTS